LHRVSCLRQLKKDKEYSQVSFADKCVVSLLFLLYNGREACDVTYACACAPAEVILKDVTNSYDTGHANCASRNYFFFFFTFLNTNNLNMPSTNFRGGIDTDVTTDVLATIFI